MGDGLNSKCSCMGTILSLENPMLFCAFFYDSATKYFENSFSKS